MWYIEIIHINNHFLILSFHNLILIRKLVFRTHKTHVVFSNIDLLNSQNKPNRKPSQAIHSVSRRHWSCQNYLFFFWMRFSSMVSCRNCIDRMSFNARPICCCLIVSGAIQKHLNIDFDVIWIRKWFSLQRIQFIIRIVYNVFKCGFNPWAEWQTIWMDTIGQTQKAKSMEAKQLIGELLKQLTTCHHHFHRQAQTQLIDLEKCVEHTRALYKTFDIGALSTRHGTQYKQ